MIQPAHLRRYRVQLALRGTGAVGPSDVDAVLALLAQLDPPPAWSGVQAGQVEDGRALQLQITTAGTGEQDAAQAVLDGVRGVLGLDAHFARFVVDARTVQVHAIES